MKALKDFMNAKRYSLFVVLPVLFFSLESVLLCSSKNKNKVTASIRPGITSVYATLNNPVDKKCLKQCYLYSSISASILSRQDEPLDIKKMMTLNDIASKLIACREDIKNSAVLDLVNITLGSHAEVALALIQSKSNSECSKNQDILYNNVQAPSKADNLGNQNIGNGSVNHSVKSNGTKAFPVEGQNFRFYGVAHLDNVTVAEFNDKNSLQMDNRTWYMDPDQKK